jgi:hypothetical protein
MKMANQVFGLFLLCVLGISAIFANDSQAGNHDTIYIVTILFG